VTKAYGGRTLFSEATLQVNRGDRIGLIGANGAGKSTLFSLILRDNEPDAGTVSIQRGISVGFLPQESAPAGDETVLELALSGVEEGDSYSLEPKAKRILSGLAFRETDFERPAKALSGGWIMRAHLAKLLVSEPDLLLLDEPTNHLDLESLGWFQSYLQNYDGAILTISHDREFLNIICESVVEISRQQLHRYAGNYDYYIEQKAAREEQYLAAYKNQQKEIAHLEDFINRFRAKASKAAQAQERIKRLDKMERLAPPERAEATVHFKFPQPPRGGQKVMALENVRQAYGEKVVYESLNLIVEKGQRTVLVGPNGAGKSTLLKILGGQIPIQGGERIVGHNITAGYFAQHRAEGLNPRHTVLQEATDLPQYVSDESARTVLGSFLFTGESVFKNVGVLSGGEKSRLALVKLLLNPPNFLLLDEPTTHLDMPSIDALIHALKNYEGTLVFVSHDVHFIRALATTVLHVHAGTLTPYAGNYEYYLEKSQTGSSARQGLVAKLNNFQPNAEPEAVAAPAAPALGMKEMRQQRRAAADARQATAKARREIEARASKLEQEVFSLEVKQNTLTAQLEDPALYNDTTRALEINRELSGVASALEKANDEWMKAAEELEALQAG
jgi:ATP-binding cassette subfamily F protein 3